MNNKNCNFAVIGGDLRQVYLCEGLASLGYTVCEYALCVDNRNPSIRHASSLEEAVRSASAILAPIPMIRNQLFNHQTTMTDLTLETLTSSLQKGQYLFAGCIPPSYDAALTERGIHTCDFMKEEEAALYNTIATAEGAISEAISKSPLNLHRSPCLILGYGRCGKTLASYLKGMFCQVTVCARNPIARAEAEILVDEAIDVCRLDQNLNRFPFVFNTIPEVLITRPLLEKLHPDALIIDIASAPGGVDYNAAKELGRSAYLCPGLPGRYAPKSSAESMIQIVTHKL
ncbi:MAG TPA: dipicolinate synthase subunit DpsA [Candidatus Pelethocola excrementipullorum]|nr:dipicolinate synthase subunit DpsA [Candidatus Pelethocola excrementipullorum]